ncbi:MAG: choice-of-anchor A family protein [Ruminococcus sp.]|nr:choice-of-anchor A family protein [Ruminococcus sp.]
MKRSLRKRLISGVTSGILAATYLLPSDLSLGTRLGAAADELPSPKYGKAYTVENILSDYSYFIREDANIMNHTVGALAIGGTARLTTFGEAAVAPSYFRRLERVMDFNPGGFIQDPELKKQFADKSVGYYNQINEDWSVIPPHLYNDSGAKLKKIDGDFIDFDTAFNEISNWSSAKKTAAGAYKFTVDDIKEVTIVEQPRKILTIDFDSMPSDIIIPREVYDALDIIMLDGDVLDIATGGYTITVDGTEPVYFRFAGDGNRGSDEPADAPIYKGIQFVDTAKPTTTFEDLEREGVQDDIQTNLTVGMNLIWNFPDSTSVNYRFCSGHVVAPNAVYSIDDGNFEGNVIAKSIDHANAEAHFYSYRSYTRAVPQYSLDLFKYDGEKKDLAGAALGLFPVNGDEVGTTPEYRIKSDGLGANNMGFAPGRYVLKEISAPNGYKLDSREYYIEIVEQGNYYMYVPEITAGHIDYSGGAAVRIYDSAKFDNVIEETSLSALAVADNTYDAQGDKLTFDIDSTGKPVKAYKNGNPLSDDEFAGDLVIKEVTEPGYALVYDGNEYYRNKNGEYRVGSDVVTIKVEDGVLTEVYRNGNKENTGSYSVKKVGKAYTVVHDGAVVTPENGCYNIGDESYSIDVDPATGDIKSITKLGKELSPDDFEFRSAGVSGYSLYRKSANPMMSSPLTRIDDNTYVYEGKNIHVEYTQSWMSRTVDSVKYEDEEASADFAAKTSTVASNYVVAYKGEAANAIINISKALSTRFEFVNEKSFTVNKINGSGEPLEGADIALVSEAYSYDGTDLTLSSSMPADGIAAKSIEGWKWSSDTTKADFTGDQIANLAVGFDGTVSNVYRIIETAAPAGYDIAAKDIVIVKVRQGFGTAYYQRTVGHGKALTDLPVNINSSSNPMMGGTMYSIGSVKDSSELGEWAKIDTDSVSGRTFNVTNRKKSFRLSVLKVDESGNALDGAEFELYRDGESEPYTGEAIKPTSSGAFAVEEALEPGTYYIVETKVPENCEEDMKDVKQYFTVNTDLTVSLGKPSLIHAKVDEASAGSQYYAVDASGARMDTSTSDGSVGYEKVVKVISYVTSEPQMFFYDGSVCNLEGNVNAGAYSDENCNAVYDEASKTFTVTFSEPVTLSKFEIAKYNGDINVSKIDFETEKDRSASEEKTAITFEASGDQNILRFENKRKPVQNDVTFIKVNDDTVFGGDEGDFSNVKNAGNKVTGAEMLLTLVSADFAGEDLSKVTSNLDGASAEEGRPEITASSIKWITADKDITFSGLPDGKYRLSETSAPEGCQPIADTTITIKNGVLTSSNAKRVLVKDKTETEAAAVTAVDEVYYAGIRKTKKLSDTEDIFVAGALLRLTGKAKDGAAVDMTGVAAKDI